MRGRDVFMQSLIAHGVERIFGNPGTTESPMLDALAQHPSLGYVVHLHEGVAVGAASYYARASGRTGVANLHVAPGLGNAIGMIYGALKAQAPLVVTAGQQDTRMLRREPVLSHDLAAMAAPVSKWSTQVNTADEMNVVMHRAFKIANDPPYGPVFVALPIDVMEQSTEHAAQAPSTLYEQGQPSPDGVAAACRLLLAAARPVIVAGDEVARSGAIDGLVALAERTGAAVWWEGIRGHLSFPASHPQARNVLPFDAAAIRRTFADADLVLMLGGPFFEEVWFTPGSPFPEGARRIQVETSPAPLGYNHRLDVGLVGGMSASVWALADGIAQAGDPAYEAAAAARRAALAEQKAGEAEAYRARLGKAWARAPISMPRAMAAVREGTPANAVVVEETITASVDYAAAFPLDDPDQYLGARGGGIGQGLAGALGAAVAHPDRPVLCLSGDGSAMYSIQALWTAAHHQLSIVFVILANREYRVLKHNLDTYRQRFDNLSERPYPHMDLGQPALGFVEMAAGMGVPGVRVSDPDQVAAAVKAAFDAGGPRLVELQIEGKR
ncbi:MAG: thiamine pyrophosphate-binding protein [Burkholderiaceae bacterium]